MKIKKRSGTGSHIAVISGSRTFQVVVSATQLERGRFWLLSLLSHREPATGRPITHYVSDLFDGSWDCTTSTGRKKSRIERERYWLPFWTASVSGGRVFRTGWHWPVRWICWNWTPSAAACGSDLSLTRAFAQFSCCGTSARA